MINKEISEQFLKNGVVLLKNIINQNWVEELRRGINFNFKNPSKYKCVYEEKLGKTYFMMIIVIGKE